jgi:hypothetical protein
LRGYAILGEADMPGVKFLLNVQREIGVISRAKISIHTELKMSEKIHGETRFYGVAVNNHGIIILF